MERLDRSTVIMIAIGLAVGFALWQSLSSIGYIAAGLLIDWWEEGDEAFTASFSIGSVDIDYGQLLGSLLTLLAAVLLAAPLLRYAARQRGAEPRGSNPLQ